MYTLCHSGLGNTSLQANFIHDMYGFSRTSRCAQCNGMCTCSHWPVAPALVSQVISKEVVDNVIMNTGYNQVGESFHLPCSYSEAYALVMGMLWKRLNDHGRNWRHVYKVYL